ncbi:hypothetical protein BOW35_03155 [Solemya velum gill symbiont]|uniref:methyltransferase n=1 Tax=Solemya velum gill symbiont TaxID=2340 RepID=UPI0009961719|nr:methyltransferase [Solemya velum gill symbiont]OOZ15825.1 hypothetical protein BOW27_02600 [Solemya velum gill symbiont]OOZ20811.1 hypothetical protein BOW29_00210 [Solemya velum gill symbiont]OOZ25194.1 hypothetical protein BOW31_02585 [Solemya velum gill symbiont]OOZ30446.1 hypothetical protein BOW33_01155 [Solemya velum gill symbiont]OOZ32501.1 hypothetical protein BOW34_03155 [Solemya velum gill symbiont]
MTDTNQANSSERLATMINGYQAGALLYTAVKLDLPDRLLVPVTATDLAHELDLRVSELERFLHALAGLDICVQTAPETYVLTDTGQLLLRESDSPLREQAVLAVEQYWSSWTALSHSLVTGQTGFQHATGVDAWEYRRDHPEQGALFQDWLAKETRAIAADIIACLDISDVTTAVDIAAGGGTLAAAMLATNPQLTVTLFDLPHVIEHTRHELDLPPGQESRCHWTGGDFFSAVPGDAELYLLKSVLHDWDSEKCLEILGHCRTAMPGDARLLVIERLLSEDPVSDTLVARLDIHMMAVNGGRERRLVEYRDLLDRSGFSLHSVSNSKSGFTILEAVPS